MQLSDFFKNPILISILPVFLALLMLGALKYEEWRCSKFKLIAEGELERAIPATTKKNVYVCTSIFYLIIFKGGATLNIANVTLPPPGTYVKIYKNGKAQFRVEVVPNPNAKSA